MDSGARAAAALPAVNTYRTLDEANQGKALLAELHDALNAWPSALRRNDDGLWTLRGRPGCYAATWGDGRSWQLVVTPDEMITKKQWTAHKKQLSFGEVTQDGDQEGVFRICVAADSSRGRDDPGYPWD